MTDINRGRFIAAADKHLLSLHREHGRLALALRKTPLLPLAEPYQRGWVRSFRLSANAARRKDAPLLLAILEAINTRQYCRSGAFLQRNHRTGAAEPAEHKLKTYLPCQWQKLNPPAAWHPYFALRLLAALSSRHEPDWIQCYVFTLPECFISTTEKNIITHSKAGAPQIQSRLHEIENHLERTNAWHRLDSLLGTRRHRRLRQRPARNNANHHAIRAAEDADNSTTRAEDTDNNQLFENNHAHV